MSLLSNIDKIERIMYNHLYKFLETNNLISSLKFGFRQKHSTSHAVIHLTDKQESQIIGFLLTFKTKLNLLV